MDPISNLPIELIKLILLQLSPKEILRAYNININIRQQLRNDEIFWQSVAHLYYPDLQPLPEQTWYNFVFYMINNSKTVPIYRAIQRGGEQYELVGELRLYKDTELRELDEINELNTIVNSFLQSEKKAKILPIIDVTKIGPTRYDPHIPQNSRRFIKFMIESNGRQASIGITTIVRDILQNYKSYRMIAGRISDIPDFFTTRHSFKGMCTGQILIIPVLILLYLKYLLNH